MMKKITFLFFLLTISFGYSQVLPFDFTGTLHGFIGDGPVLTNGTGNDVLEITAGVADWDNAQVTFAAPINLSDAANNTLRFTMQSTTAAPGEVHQHGVSFQGGGGAIEANFITTGTDVANVELNFVSGLGSRDKMVIFTDVGNFGAQSASGGQSGTPTPGLSGTYIIDNISLGADPETCSDGIQNQDETGIDCGGVCAPCDVTAPTGFTATAGTIGAFSVELLLNATDEVSANITYNVTGGATVQTTGASGVQKSLIISGLTPDTDYVFNVSASDASGNPAANNAIAVNARTLVDTSNECEGQSAESDGVFAPFTIGYTYKFETLPSGTDVKINFKMLDTDKADVSNVQLFQAPGTFTNMTPVGGNEWTITLAGQVNATDLSLAARFPFAGGLSQTKNFIYTVGEDCLLGTLDFNKASFSLFPNPTKGSWNVISKNINISSIKVFDVLGKNVLSLKPNASEVTIDGSSLKAGLYFAQIKTASGVSSLKLIKN